MEPALEWYKNAELWMLIVTVVSVIASAKGVIYQVKKSRETSKRLKAFDVINSIEYKPVHENGLKVLREFNDNEKTISRLVEDKYSEQCDDILELLNHYEYLAVGVKEDILCEKTLRKANYTSFLIIYEGSEEFITSLRKKYDAPTVFSELEWMYKRWKKAGYDGPLPLVD